MNTTSNLEQRVIEQVNQSLIPRKSTEVFDLYGDYPLTLKEEVRESALRSMEHNKLEIPVEILDSFMNRDKIDLKKIDDVMGYNLFWAVEMEATKVANAMGGGTYQDYLGGRFLHYDNVGYHISHLYNGSENSIKGKRVLELGSGSGLGLMRLALEGAIVTGLDSSIMANDYANYLSRHYNVSSDIQHGNYFCTPFEDGEFDVVYSSGVFEHLDKPQELLKEMERITKPGGHVVITIPNEKSRFYNNFKNQEKEMVKQFPGLIGIPVEHHRHKSLDPERLMIDYGFEHVTKDGVLVAPSTKIKKGDILEEDLTYFNANLPRNPSAEAEHKVAFWRSFELLADSRLRTQYGWSLIYSGKKPVLSGPMSNN